MMIRVQTQLTRERIEPIPSRCPRQSLENRKMQLREERHRARSHKMSRYCGVRSADVELTTSSRPKYGPKTKHGKLA